MSAVLISILVGPKLSVAIIIGLWDVGWGRRMAANIPVVVNIKAPEAGFPPNCLTEQENFICWNFSTKEYTSFFSELRQTYKLFE